MLVTLICETRIRRRAFDLHKLAPTDRLITQKKNCKLFFIQSHDYLRKSISKFVKFKSSFHNELSTLLTYVLMFELILMMKTILTIASIDIYFVELFTCMQTVVEGISGYMSYTFRYFCVDMSTWYTF